MILEVTGLHCHYGPVHAVKGMDFAVDQGRSDRAHRGERRGKDDHAAGDRRNVASERWLDPARRRRPHQDSRHTSASGAAWRYVPEGPSDPARPSAWKRT